MTVTSWDTGWVVLGRPEGVGMGRWLTGESPVAIVCSGSLWGRAAEGDKASGPLGL